MGLHVSQFWLVFVYGGAIIASDVAAARAGQTPLITNQFPCSAENLRTSSRYTCTSDSKVICNPGWRNAEISKTKEAHGRPGSHRPIHAPQCQLCCEPICDWDGQSCESTGLCVAPNSCACDVGWAGKRCEDCITIGSCVHGNCSLGLDCNCFEGWDGFRCNNPTCYPECNNGICIAPNECECYSGWMGPHCDICKPLDGCVHGTCTYSPYACDCDPGWSGHLCDKPVCSDGCHPDHGHCCEPNTCLCKAGWRGPTCSDCIPMHNCPNQDAFSGQQVDPDSDNSPACHVPWECRCTKNFTTSPDANLCNCFIYETGTDGPAMTTAAMAESPSPPPPTTTTPPPTTKTPPPTTTTPPPTTTTAAPTWPCAVKTLMALDNSDLPFVQIAICEEHKCDTESPGTFFTDENGYVVAGNYLAGTVLHITAYKDGYEVASGKNTIVANNSEDCFTLSLVPKFKENELLRVVLNWGTRPLDLDIHAVKISGSGSATCDINWLSTECEGARLDVDNTEGGHMGAETITFPVAVGGLPIYLYYVEHSFNKKDRGDASLTIAKGRLSIYEKMGNMSKSEVIEEPTDCPNCDCPSRTELLQGQLTCPRIWVVGCYNYAPGLEEFGSINVITDTWTLQEQKKYFNYCLLLMNHQRAPKKISL